MGHAVGIDLGTTNTVVAAVVDGTARVLSDDAGDRLIPSVVAFPPNGGVLVGRRARERRRIDAQNTIHSVKRLIGRAWSSEEVVRARTYLPFDLKEGAHGLPLVVSRGRTFDLHTISAFVLQRAKKLAEKVLGGTVDAAVITVPASFNDRQRAATKAAGSEAGLRVLRILNEPTAAALAYGLGRTSPGAHERVAVYDLGGGTFDLTLLDLSSNVFEVLGTAGDSFLGGDDLDLLIVDELRAEILKQTRFDPRGDVQVMERLSTDAEQVKIALSDREEVEITFRDLAAFADGHPIGATILVRRASFERLAAPLVERSIEVCREALAVAKLGIGDFGDVLLVGGSTRIPLVRRKIEQFFQRPPRTDLDPDEVVAIGAAIQADALVRHERPEHGEPRSESARTASGRRNPALPSAFPGRAQRAGPLLVDVTPLTLGVETVSGFVEPVIERNTAVPCSQTRIFTTAKDGQGAITVRVFQGEGRSLGENVLLGELSLDGLREARRGEVQVEVTFALDADGILQVSARDPETARAVSATLKVGRTS
ncbi:MAG: Hsp70 family protein [Deltaproteobacteria bacterium]|nr:Hsp70 family protein [Deltaproteobacteria bacterium]